MSWLASIRCGTWPTLPASAQRRNLPAGTALTALPVVLLVWALAAGSVAPAALAAERVNWKTGADLNRQLAAVVSLDWPENPLRDAIERLSRDQQVAMLIDRNVDPGMIIDITERGTSLAHILDHLADRGHLGVCFVGPAVYFAPQNIAARTGVLADLRSEEAASLPQPAAARVMQPRGSAWEMLAEPRELVAQAAADYGVRVVNLERIPHDLWAAGSLPPLTFAQRMSLLLAGFNLTFEWAADGSAVRLIDVDDSAVVPRDYPIPGDARMAMTQLARAFPKADIQRASGGIRITAGFADHYGIERAMRGAAAHVAAEADAGTKPAVANVTPKPGPPPTGEITTFTLEVKNVPAGAVVAKVAKDREWKLKFDRATGARLQRLISLDVKGVLLEQLMAKTLDPLGLDWKQKGDTLEVFPKGR